MEITGRVTADATVRTLSDERQVVNFAIAVNDTYKAKNGERVTQTEFFDCSLQIYSNSHQWREFYTTITKSISRQIVSIKKIENEAIPNGTATCF